jgi:hypothetical protein
MKAMINALVLAGIAMLPSQVLAQAAAVVEGVQMPAWVERAGGGRAPLAPGMQLRAGDQVRTGANSRLLVKLSEGSQVKLGENGFLRIAEVEPDRGGVFRAALGVAEGAFRFTTDALIKNRRRDVSISVGTVTAGIRGTDLWGKQDRADRQIVCLIEGRIEVGASGETPVVLDRSRQFYVRDKGVTAPIGFVEPEQLGVWAKETEIAAGAGAARLGGRYRLNLGQSDTQQGALAIYDQLREAGYAAEIRPVKAGEKITYYVRIANLPSRGEAESLATQLRGKYGVGSPTVSG